MFSPYCVTKGLDWMSNSCVTGAERRSWMPLQRCQCGSPDNCCSSSECWKGPHCCRDRDPHHSSPLLLWGSWRSPQLHCCFSSATIKVIFQPSWLCSCSNWGTTWLISSLFGTHITFLHFISSSPREVTHFVAIQYFLQVPRSQFHLFPLSWVRSHSSAKDPLCSPVTLGSAGHKLSTFWNMFQNHFLKPSFFSH